MWQYIGVCAFFVYSYSSDAGYSYDVRSDMEHHRLICSVSGGAILKHGWRINGGLSIEKGSHDKDRTISLTAKRVFSYKMKDL